MPGNLRAFFQRLPCEVFVVAPFFLDFAAILGITPVEHTGMKTQNIPDAGPVKMARCIAQHIVIDINGFRHSPAAIDDIAVHTDAGALPIDGIDA